MFVNGLASFALIPYIDNKITHLMLLKSNNNLFFIPEKISQKTNALLFTILI